jgi:hypothetical protein
MRLRALLLLLLALLLLAGCGGKKSSTSTPLPTIPTGTLPTSSKPPQGRSLTISLKSAKALQAAKLAAFASLSRDGKSQGTQLLSTKPVHYTLTSGKYQLVIIFSTCGSNCAVIHDGVNLSPIPVNGAVSQTLVVDPSCRKVSFGTGIDCSATKIKR